MTDGFISVGKPSYLKRLTQIGSGVYADSVVNAAAAIEAEVVVAGASSVLGKIGTVPAGVTLFVRADCSDKPWTALDWRLLCDKACTYQLYKARTAVNSVTVTLASLANGETGIINGLTFTAQDTATNVNYATRNFNSGGADATADAASLKKAINPGTTITLANVTAGEQVVVNGVTYTAHATTTTAANREFAINGTDAQDATALASVLNDGTYGCGVVCEAFGAVVSMPGTVACTGTATMVVGSWAGVPGVTATSALGVVTLVATTATVIQAVTGTAAGHWAVASTTLTALVRDGAAVPGVAADTTSAGFLIRQWLDGYPQAYIGITNNDSTNAATMVVGAARIP